MNAEAQISVAPPSTADFGLCARQLAALRRDAESLADSPEHEDALALIRGSAIEPGLEAALQADLEADAAGELRGRPGSCGQVIPLLLDSASNVARVLDSFWCHDFIAPPRAPGGEDAASTKDAERRAYESALDFYEGRLPPAVIAWLRGAEDALATATTLFLRHYMRPFRILTTVVLVGGLWMLLMVSTYAIDSRRLSMTFLWVGVLASAATGLWMFVQFDRDELLSRIGRTTAGEVTFNGGLVRRVFTWGVLPILSVAAVQYPSVTQSLFAWLQPLMLALR